MKMCSHKCTNPDNFISDSVSVLPISYGQHVFYKTFINFNILVLKCNTSSCSIKQRNAFLPICLLYVEISTHAQDLVQLIHLNVVTLTLKFFKKEVFILYMLSLLRKLHEISDVSRRTRAACICLTETWLDDSVPDLEIFIDNYCVKRKDRNRHGGGVCIYFRKDRSFNSRQDLVHEDLEATWIELLLPKSKPILCGCLYRPPTQQSFYTILDSLCSSSSHF